MTKDKNDLFNYLSPTDIETKTITTNQEIFLAKNDAIAFYEDLTQFEQDETPIGHISIINEHFFFGTQYKGEEYKERAWLPIKQFQPTAGNKRENYALHQGDVIRLGRIELKIRTIHIEGLRCTSIASVVKNELQANTSQLQNLRSSTNFDSIRRTCRICFCDEMQGDSPLVNPCQCSGGIKYIHLNCLQKWLKTKGTLRSSTNENCITYTYRKVCCELCKEVFPDLVKSGEDYHEIWDFMVPPFKSYIISETISNTNDTQGNIHKTIYIINFNNKNKITIGRTHEADLRIRDLSVSRCHAQMELTKNKDVILQDLGSKFGSIILIQSQTLPIVESPLTIQFGRNLVTMNVKFSKDFSLFKCCACRDVSMSKSVDYNRLNSEKINLAKSFTIKEERIDDEDEDDCPNEKTQENDSDKTKNSYSDIEEDIPMRQVNNQCFGLKQLNENHVENKPKKKEKGHKRNKRTLTTFRTFTLFKKYEVEFNEDNYQEDTQGDNIRTFRMGSKSGFEEDL